MTSWMQVYRAFGMHFEAPQEVRKRWHHPHKKPIYEMAERDRWRSLTMSTPVVRVAISAFTGSKNW